VRAALTEVPGVRGVNLDAGATSDLATYLVDTEARSGVSEALASSIVAGGFGLLEMGPAPVDLEELFLGLTGGHFGARA
jgi:hypothetical protein